MRCKWLWIRNKQLFGKLPTNSLQQILSHRSVTKSSGAQTMCRFEERSSQFVPRRVQVKFDEFQIPVNDGCRIVVNWIPIRSCNRSTPIFLSSRDTKRRNRWKTSLLSSFDGEPIPGSVMIETSFSTLERVPEFDASQFDTSKPSVIAYQANDFTDQPIPRVQFRVKNNVFDLISSNINDLSITQTT
jgi:hypothetical protein